MKPAQKNLDQKNLSALIAASPISDERKKKLEKLLPKMSDEQKIRLLNVIYAEIIQHYNKIADEKIEAALLEMAKGEKKYTPRDFQRIEEEVWNKFFQKESLASDEIDIDHIRDSLKTLQEKLKNISDNADDAQGLIEGRFKTLK